MLNVIATGGTVAEALVSGMNWKTASAAVTSVDGQLPAKVFECLAEIK
jgi:hypothetical protein